MTTIKKQPGLLDVADLVKRDYSGMYGGVSLRADADALRADADALRDAVDLLTKRVQGLEAETAALRGMLEDGLKFSSFYLFRELLLKRLWKQ